MHMSVQSFLEKRTAQLHQLSTALNQAYWEFTTTGSGERQAELVRLKEQLAQFFANREDFEQLKAFKAEGISDPLSARQVEHLYNLFLANQVEPAHLAKIIELETRIESAFTNFRANCQGKRLSNNEIYDVLQNSTDSAERKEVYFASKQIGGEIAPTLIELVQLRNRSARELGFPNFYSLSLQISDLNEGELFEILDRLKTLTDEPFRIAKERVDRELCAKYGLSSEELMPWHYSDPFFQEAPASGDINVNQFFLNQDVVELSKRYYSGIGLEVEDILARSDLYEREGKHQHAYCTHIDGEGDVRVLCNVRHNDYWMNTILHELGHGVYDKYLDMSLPRLLREPAHSFTTEAIAIMFGRLSRDPEWLKTIAGADPAQVDSLQDDLFWQEQLALLVFIRWGLVMVYFERELYKNPEQNLNALWWDLVERLQYLQRPEGRNAPDWAAKVHLGTFPVYYQNYLLGFLAAYQIEAAIKNRLGLTDLVNHPAIGAFLIEQIFQPGARDHWNVMLENATGSRLTPDFAVEIFSA